MRSLGSNARFEPAEHAGTGTGNARAYGVVVQHCLFHRMETGNQVGASWLDQHVAQLRKKIEAEPETPAVILTVHGVGYRSAG